jgi:hypothetical protein
MFAAIGFKVLWYLGVLDSIAESVGPKVEVSIFFAEKFNNFTR